MVLTEIDYFATSGEIMGLLHIGTSADSTEFSETDLDYVLPIIQGLCHDFLMQQGLVTTVPVVSTTTGFNTVKNVLVTLLEDWNQRRQANKLNNQMGGFPNAGSYHPTLSDQHKVDLFQAFFKGEEDSVDTIPLYRGPRHEVYNS